MRILQRAITAVIVCGVMNVHGLIDVKEKEKVKEYVKCVMNNDERCDEWAVSDDHKQYGLLGVGAVLCEKQNGEVMFLV